MSVPYPYVHTYKDRLGKTRTYFRRGSSRIALPMLGTREFDRAYRSAFGKECDTSGEMPPPFRARVRRTKVGLERRRARSTAAGVYLLMLAGRIVYVGSSEDMATRVAGHRTNGRQFDRAFYIGAPTAKERLALEALLIAKLQPEQNRLGTKCKTD